ncbi:LacI family DNA-binding transcriptional regulator [Amnibacterium kyonggiense]|uniref:LacI family transcriptional regulator n=1 Tax=Amnibacterium kyonggiense TaxID=595671 RepID=A0A4R7FLI1_9MICO|nr:LacI family DNA-binding transcriptional regulator [Amnibacterium kyonggiense]TDS77237.1 LacI family transcriptional regulator [Amnibacterium kyonggiense]
MTKKSTIALVAQHAGVSVASVSRVLNGLPASPAITERVQASAAALGYAPDASARRLRVGRTEQIAFAVADLGNPVYTAMTRTITEEVQEGGFRLLLASTGQGADGPLGLLTDLDGSFVDGLILSPLQVDERVVERLRGRRHPIVVIGSVPDDVPVDSVRADSMTGVRLALEHLVAQGRRRIAFVNGPVDTVPGAARLAGYVRGCDALGLVTHQELQVVADDFTYEAGLPAARRVLDQCVPDAILCANDLLGVAALNVLRERGLRVPEDVAVVGMDDTDLAGMTRPALTSVDLGSIERARRAAQLLLRRLGGFDGPPERVVVEPTLRVRASSGGAA